MTSGPFDSRAPLGHHWQDSTHISYGVLTLVAFTESEPSCGTRYPMGGMAHVELRVAPMTRARAQPSPTNHALAGHRHRL
jgi:hypothetical protein